MIFTLNTDDLLKYTEKLILNYFPDTNNFDKIDKKTMQIALDRLENCFSNIKLKYYLKNKLSYFNHLNSDHMASYIYFLSNTIWLEKGNKKTSQKLFYLNKILHGIDLFYEITMPDIFLLVHPVGTVIGRGKYSNNLVIYQNCTIGSNKKDFPTFGKNVILFSKSSVIGNSKIGNNVTISANAFVIDKNIKKNSIIFGSSPNNLIKRLEKNYIKDYFYDY